MKFLTEVWKGQKRRSRFLEFGPLLFILGVVAVGMLRAILMGNRDFSHLFTASTDQPPMVQACFEVFGGKPPASIPYGLSLCAISWWISWPLMFVGGIFSKPFDFSDFVVLFRLVQVACGLGSLFLVFCLARRYMRVGFALICVANLACGYAFLFWSVMIKPDILLLFFLFLSFWFLIEAVEMAQASALEASRRQLVFGAGAVGLAIGSKAWGIFALPSLVLALASVGSNHTGFSVRNWMGFLGRPLVAFVLMATISMPNFIFHYPEISQIFRWVSQRYNTLSTVEAVPLLFLQKIQLLVSWQFAVGHIVILGMLFCIYKFYKFFIGFCIQYRGGGSFVESLRESFCRLPSELVIVTYAVTSLVFLFTLYKDTFNIIGGERNVLPLVFVLAILGFTFLEAMLSSSRLFLKGAGAVAAVLAFLWMLGTVFGGLKFDWQPLAKVIHEDSFKQIIHNVPEADKSFWLSQFQTTSDGTQHLLKSVNAENQERFRQISKRLSLERGPRMVFDSSLRPDKILNSYMNSFDTGGFKIRQWIAQNATSGDIVLIEYYVDLWQGVCYFETNDIPLGLKSEIVSSNDMVLTPEALAAVRPRFAITKYPLLARQLEGKTNYKIVYSTDDNVVVLERIK